MQWVLVDNNQIKLMRLSAILTRNGFSVHTRHINFELYYCFDVPYQYDMDQFTNNLPVINDFLFENRTIMIKL